jgi:ABC-type amino acid transport substrate-binding protein
MDRFFWVILLSSFLTAFAGAQALRAGVAIGFPPYQYVDGDRPAGLDVALAEALAREAGVSLVWVQRPWDEVVAILRTSHDLDLIVGMEQTVPRGAQFLFGRPLYSRKSQLFVLSGGPPIRSLSDLTDRAVAGDRDAFGEVLLNELGLRSDVRLVRTQTKEEAFTLLVHGQVGAAFMPEAVGWALARERGVAVQAVNLGDKGTPVGLAFAKDRADLCARFDAAATRLEKSGALAKILRLYFP